MSTREEKIAELRRRDKIAKLRARDAQRAQSAGAPNSEAKPDSYYIDNAIDGIKGAARGVSDAVTGFNIGESIPIVGPLAAKAGDYVASKISSGLTGKDSAQLYDQMQAEGQKRDADYAERFPKLQFYKDVAGSAMLPGPKGFQSAEGAGRIAKTAVGTANLGLRVGEAGAETAADAYLRGQDPEESGKKAVGWSLGMNLAPKVIGAAAKGGAYALTGLKPSTIEKYRGLPDERRYMGEEERAFNLSRDASEVERAGDELKVRADQSFGAKKDEALARQAEDIKSIERKRDRTREEHLAEADRIQRGVGEDFVESQKGARKRVSEGSGIAHDIAEQSGAKFSIPRLKAGLTAKMNEMKIRGVAPEDADYRTLERYHEKLGEMGKESLTGGELKQLLKWIDSDAETAFANKNNPGAYNTPGERGLMSVRGTIDSRLKKNPEYAAQMEVVSGDTRALNNARDAFGSTGDDVYKNLKKLREIQNRDKDAVLKGYEERFGGDYSKRLDEADAIRGTDFDELFAPDLSKVKEGTSKQLEGLEQIRARRRMEGNRKIDLAKGMTTEQNAVQRLRRYGNNPEKNFFYGNDMKALAREKGLPENAYTQMAEDNSLINAMSGTHERGSRNVNLGAWSLGGLGRLAGEKTGAVGHFLGGALGAVADLVGAKPAKILVDYLDSPNASKWSERLGKTKGEAISRVYEAAAKRGPQGIAMAHKMYMKKDPEYRAIFESEGDDE